MENLSFLLDSITDSIMDSYRNEYQHIFDIFDNKQTYSQRPIYYALKHMVLKCWDFYKNTNDNATEDDFFKIPLMHNCYYKFLNIIPDKSNIYIEHILKFINFYLNLIVKHIAKSLGYENISENSFQYLKLESDGNKEIYDRYDVSYDIYPKIHKHYPPEIFQDTQFIRVQWNCKDFDYNKLSLHDIEALKKRKVLDIQLEEIKKILIEQYFTEGKDIFVENNAS